jgi:hypothetical protein
MLNYNQFVLCDSGIIVLYTDYPREHQQNKRLPYFVFNNKEIGEFKRNRNYILIPLARYIKSID